MSSSISINQENLCVNVEKVYDWIIEESTGSTTVPVATMPLALPVDSTDVVADCILTDATGAPFPINSEVSVTEVAPREDRQFEIDGALVTLQRVTFSKVLYVVLKVSGVDPETGTPFIITSLPRPFNFVESEFLCAPAGTSLIVRISNFTCLTTINRNETGAITGFGLRIFVCQSIKTFAPATIRLSADFCNPRELLTEQCANPIMPPQCPTIFPGA